MAAPGTSATRAHARPSLVRPLLCFLGGGFALTVGMVMVWDIGDLVWVDFIHHNPNRSQENALEMMAWSPFLGLLFALLGAELPLIAGAVMAAAAHRFWGRIPFWTLLLMLPVCVGAMYVQGLAVAPPDEPVAFGIWQFLWGSRLQLPVLLGCWWCSRARSHVE